MRISDWSSDVCSSDLTAAEALGVNALLDGAEQFGGIVIAAWHESVGHAWHGRVGIAFAAAVAGGRDAHKAGVQAILHIIFQDAVLYQDILLRRGAFVVDGKRSASVHDAAIVDDRHAGRCHALAEPAGEGRRARAVELARQR